MQLNKYAVLGTVVAGVLGVSLCVQAKSLKVMSYNLQNLFDTIDNSSTKDEEFTPNGKQRWTEQVLRDKMKNLGEVIATEDPDVIGVSEVENQEILERFVREGLAGRGYKYVVSAHSDDPRGIRNGVISKYPLDKVKSHRVWRDSWRNDDGSVSKTRDVLEVTATVAPEGRGSNAQAITFLVNHWPSRAGDTATRNRYRLEVAQQMQTIADEILKRNSQRMLIALGDFNDEYEDASIQEGLNIIERTRVAGAQAAFFVLDSELLRGPRENRGTFFFWRDKVWNTLDHLMVAQGLDYTKGNQGAFHYVPGSVKVVKPRFAEDGKPQGCEMLPSDIARGRIRTSCPNGASDHRPLVATFQSR